MRKSLDLSLYLVLDPVLCGEMGMETTARLAARGGVTVVQLRNKSADRAGLVSAGRALKAALTGFDVPMIVNDDVEAAVEIGADGVHVGQADTAATVARAAIGNDLILGLSVETEDLARAVDPAIVDYVGIGPVFATATKPDHKQPIGIDGLARAVAVSPVPAVAIGGLKQMHIASVLATGARGLAVVSAICGNADPEKAAAEFAAEIRRVRS